MSPKTSLPEWIHPAFDPTYLRNVLGVLSEREHNRDEARDASRDQVASSAAERRFFKPQKPAFATPEQIDYFSVRVGTSKENDTRNRYLALVPYDRTRVIVNNEHNNGYLNASWVSEKYGRKLWIATQAPLPGTAYLFLTFLSNPIARPPSFLSSTTASPITRVRTIVQLTQNIESSRRKAHAYFPHTVGKSWIVPAETGQGALKVTLLRQETVEDAHCVRSTIQVVPVTNPPPVTINTYDSVGFDESDGGPDRFGEQAGQRAVFTHLLYTSWPDHGVPEIEDQRSLVSCIRLADRLNRDISLSSYPPAIPSSDEGLDPDPPIVVGCSAGVGRTGSFITLSSIMRHAGVLPPAALPTPSAAPSPLGPLPEVMAEDCVAQEIDALREQRQRMVERLDQVVFIYKVLADVLQAP